MLKPIWNSPIKCYFNHHLHISTERNSPVFQKLCPYWAALEIFLVSKQDWTQCLPLTDANCNLGVLKNKFNLSLHWTALWIFENTYNVFPWLQSSNVVIYCPKLSVPEIQPCVCCPDQNALVRYISYLSCLCSFCSLTSNLPLAFSLFLL